MTNLIATVSTVLVTNWVLVGTYQPITGYSEQVKRGRIVTNIVATVEWRGEEKTILLETRSGPDIGEHRFPLFNAPLPGGAPPPALPIPLPHVDQTNSP